MSKLVDPKPDAAPGPEKTEERRRFNLSILSFSRISGVYVWIAIIIVFSLWVPNTFLTELTWKNIASSESITALVTLGILFPLAAGVYDLSVGQMIGFSAIFSAWLVQHGFDTGTAIAACVGIGVIVGVFNGILVAGIGINSFIGTLATSSLLLAATGAVSNRQQIIGLPHSFANLGQSQPFGIPITVLYLVVAAIIAWVALEHTPFGRYLFAIGDGSEAARLAGVPNRRLIALSLILNAVVAALAGVLVTARLGAGDPEAGSSFLLAVFAAAFLGATQIKPGRFNVPGTLIAVYLLATGVSGLQLAGAQFWITDLFNGVVLIIALTLAATQGRLKFGRLRSASGAADKAQA